MDKSVICGMVFIMAAMVLYFHWAVQAKKKAKVRAEEAWEKIKVMINEAVAEQLKQQKLIEEESKE